MYVCIVNKERRKATVSYFSAKKAGLSSALATGMHQAAEVQTIPDQMLAQAAAAPCLEEQ